MTVERQVAARIVSRTLRKYRNGSRANPSRDSNGAVPEAVTKNMERVLQIGAVAKQTGLTVDAIRFYEKERLLKRPARTEGGFRLFSGQDVEDVRFIRRAQALGFSLSEIRELLILQGEQLETCSHVRDVLKDKLKIVREKIAQLQKFEGEL